MTEAVTETAAGLDPRIAEAFRESRERRAAEYRKFVELVAEEIVTSPQPLTANDIQTLLEQDGVHSSLSRIRQAIGELMDMARIVSRVETPEETLIRGAGVALSRRRPTLYAAAPGPVPERTALPPGIEPTVEPVPLDKRVLELLATKYPAGSKDRPRSVGKIADALDVTRRELQPVLDRLVAHGKVRLNHGHYSLASRRRPNYPAHRTPTPHPEPTGIVTVVDGVTASDDAPATSPDRERIRLLVEQAVTAAAELATLAGAEDADRVDRMLARIRDLEQENAELRMRLQRFNERLHELLG